VVIDKKLFARALKISVKEHKIKKILRNLKRNYDAKFEDLKNVLIEKLFTIVNGKTAQGVYNDLGEEVVTKR
jgi:DNA-directed RNA polymerase subunit beta